jgi:hypothetical protein
VQSNLVDASTASGKASAELKTSARRNALSNGLRAALALRAADLKPLVQALTEDGDGEIRKLADAVLDQWGRSP